MTDQGLAGYDHDPGRQDTGRASADAAGMTAPASPPELKTLVSLVVAVIVVTALYVAQGVLIRVTLAVMLSFVLAPLVNLLRRLHVWRVPSVILSVLVALGVIGLVGTLIGSQAAGLAADAPRYAATLEQKAVGAQTFASARLLSLTAAFRARTPVLPSAKPVLQTSPPGVSNAAPQPKPTLVQVVPPERSAFVVARTIVEPVLAPLESTVIVVIIAIFVLMQKEDLRDRFIRVFGSNDLHRTTLAMDDAAQRLSRYFLSQLAVNTCFGVVIGLGLWAIGIPSAPLWGVLGGLLRFVPYIGSFIAALVPIALGAAIDPGWTKALYTVGLFVVVEPLTAYVVEPLLYGHSTGLSPVSVIVAAVFWTWLWGPIGLLLSTPLTLCIVVMGRHVRSLEFFDVLLGDRPALSAVENFYQRMLANNPDEALDKAAGMLTDRSLLDYYDEVVLQGLRLAAEDEARGAITRGRAAELTRTMISVIDDLDDHVDAKAVADGGASPKDVPAASGLVACIAGRGPFDDAVAAMLAQVLSQRGVTTRRVPHAAVERGAIEGLDLAGVSVITVSYLHLTGTPIHLRSLMPPAAAARTVSHDHPRPLA